MDKLLIVDDEDAMRKLLRINLNDRYEIADTGNSEEALAMAMQGKPKAILLDLRMPNYSGFELCRTFRSMSPTQLIPIVIISGEAGATTKSLCKELGATAYFEKPVDFEALRVSLERILHAAQPDRRSEIRVHLRVMLKLSGTDINQNPFEEEGSTENISKNSFFCGCTSTLEIGSVVEVRLGADWSNFVGRADVVRSERCDTPYPRYAFRFTEKTGSWILE